MAKEDLKATFVLTAPVRVSMPQVLAPRTPDFGNGVLGKPSYSARLVFPADHPDLVPLKQLAAKILRVLDPTGDFKVLRPQRMVNGKQTGDFWYAFKTGDELIREAKERAIKKNQVYKGYEDWMSGFVTLNAKTGADQPPQVEVAVNGRWQKVDPAIHKAMFYNGMEVYAGVTLSGSSNPKGEYGVSCYLNGIGATGRGERTGGGREDVVFPNIAGEVSQTDPTADGNEIAF